MPAFRCSVVLVSLAFGRISRGSPPAEVRKGGREGRREGGKGEKQSTKDESIHVQTICNNHSPSPPSLPPLPPSLPLFYKVLLVLSACVAPVSPSWNRTSEKSGARSET